MGGKRADRPGLYMEPTIFCDVEDHMYIAKEESFGPIMVIIQKKYIIPTKDYASLLVFFWEVLPFKVNYFISLYYCIYTM